MTAAGQALIHPYTYTYTYSNHNTNVALFATKGRQLLSALGSVLESIADSVVHITYTCP